MKGAGILLAAALAAHDSNAVMLHPAAKMYFGPDLQRDVVSQSIYVANVQILESREGWHNIRSEDQYTGWVESSALPISEKSYPNTGTVAIVTSLFANLYPEPSIIRRQPLLIAPFETRLELFGKFGDDKFIHATAHQRPIIRISTLGDAHWSKVFIGARRLK